MSQPSTFLVSEADMQDFFLRYCISVLCRAAFLELVDEGILCFLNDALEVLFCLFLMSLDMFDSFACFAFLVCRLLCCLDHRQNPSC